MLCMSFAIYILVSVLPVLQRLWVNPSWSFSNIVYIYKCTDYKQNMIEYIPYISNISNIYRICVTWAPTSIATFFSTSRA